MQPNQLLEEAVNAASGNTAVDQLAGKIESLCHDRSFLNVDTVSDIFEAKTVVSQTGGNVTGPPPRVLRGRETGAWAISPAEGGQMMKLFFASNSCALASHIALDGGRRR